MSELAKSKAEEPLAPELLALYEALDDAQDAAEAAGEQALSRAIGQVRILHAVGAVGAVDRLLGPVVERVHQAAREAGCGNGGERP